MKRTLIFSLILLIGWTGQSQNTRIEKNYDKTFLISDETRIEVVNKYGDVIVNTWYKDSVRLKVVVEAEGKNQDAVNKEINRVDVNLRQVGFIVSGATKFDPGKSKGIFSDLVGQVSDYSKSVVGGKRLTVDYEIWMPSELNLSIENKYGDVYLSTLSGVVNLDLSHGDLRANKIENELMLKHGFGNQTFDYIEEGNLTLRGVESKIPEAKRLVFESSSSEIDLGKIEEIQLISRNDKYFIDETAELIGEGSFTDLRVDFVTQNLRLDFDYGEIFLSRIEKDFGKIFLNGKSCDINLILNQASYINTSIAGEEDKMILPNSMLIMDKKVLEEFGQVLLTGYVGNTNTTHSTLEINADGGELIISIKETDIFTNRD